MSAKRLTNFRLSEYERGQMKRLAARLGLSEARTVARALEVLETYLDGAPLIEELSKRQSSTSPR
jgi:hypothetical protein